MRQDQAYKAIVMAVGGLWLASAAEASLVYWDGTGTTWGALSAWSTDSANPVPDPSAVPGIGDDAVFNISGVIANQVFGLDATRSIQSLTFNSPGTFVINGSGAGGSGTARTFVVGSGGITMSPGNGTVQFGQSSNTVNLRLGASQTWTNNSSSTMTVRNNFGVDTSVTSPITLTIAGGASIGNSGGVSDNTANGGSLAIVVNTTGGTFSIAGSSSYTGGVTVKSGTMSGGAGTAFGTGTIRIGDTVGSANATVSGSSTATYANNIIVQSGSTGTATLAGAASQTQTWSGTITLDKELTLNPSNAMILSGLVTGSGGLRKSGGTVTISGANNYSGGTTVTGGTLVLGHDDALGSGNLNLASNAIIRSADSADRTIVNPVVLQTTTTVQLTFGSASTGNLTFSQHLAGDGYGKTVTANNARTTFPSYSTTAGGLAINGTGVFEITGNASLPGGAVTIGGTSVHSTLLAGTLNNTNGNILLTNGVLGTSGTIARVLGTSTGNTRIAWGANDGGLAAYGGDLAVNVSSGATLTWNSTNFVQNTKALVLGHAMATHTVDFQNPLNFNAQTQTVRVDNGAAAVDAVLSGALTNGGLTKTGTGTLALTASSSYSGATNITAGILKLGASGSIAGSALVDVAAGAVFDTTSQGFAMSGSQTIKFEIDPAAGSVGRLSAAALDITNGTIDFGIAGTLDDQAYILASYSSLTGTSFAAVNNLPAGYQLDYNYQGNHQVALVVPEPGTVALAVMTSGFALMLRKRRARDMH